MKKKLNLVLIGMPSAGKTTIGKQLEKLLNKQYIDMDDEIIKKTSMSIPEIFQRYGEDEFRRIESEVAASLSKTTNKIIATGGGVIKNPLNIKNLKENGVIIFIDRSLDKLIGYDSNRPLSSSKEAVKKLYQERYFLYTKYADIIVKNDEDIDSCINKIIAQYNQY